MILRSLQRRIVLVFVGLLALVMALILALVTRSNGSIVAAEIERELSAGTHVFTLLIEQNQRQLETAATVLSADFGFREAIATQDRPTILSVIRNHGLRINAQVMMVISPERILIADTQSDALESRPFPFPELLPDAASAGKSSGFREMRDGRLYQIVLVPISAPKVIAWVAMGFLVDDKWARDLSEMTGLAVSVVRHRGNGVTVFASSLDGAKRTALSGALTQWPDNVTRALPVGDEHFQTIQVPLGHEASVVLQRSIEQAEAPFRSLQTVLWTIVLAGIVIFALGSLMLARRIVRPINQLAMAARRIEAGNYAEPVPSLPPDEIGQLAISFDLMRVMVASRENEILKLAYEDTLTGLPNRTRFLEVFSQLPKDSQGAVAVLNLDRFALINNALGHSIGDRLLNEIGLRFAHFLSGTGLVARLWGDEFAFLLQGVDQAAATEFAETVLRILRDPVTLDGQRFDVGGGIGIALYPRHGQDGATLLRRAELAMYAAKRSHNSVAFAGDAGDEPPHEQLSLIGEMREAMAHNEFLLHYQPKLDLVTRKITGAEALIRWRHPERGLVPPIRFIPFAEQTGFIREITPWVLETVAAHTAQWRKDGLFIVPSINLSARDLLNPGLVGHMRTLIGSHGIPADGLCLEITESALMEDPQLALAHLGELAALGFKLSIDDYGVGQASLAYLKTLPVHELKIDQTFVRSIADSPRNAAIVRSTIVLCHALGLTVVAEGAETTDDLDWLASNECDIAQGFGIARPMPAEELPVWIANYGRTAGTSP
jgi:diguanylate cyclase (GGDEF)-like protein